MIMTEEHSVPKRRRSPWWALFCVWAGAALALAGGGTVVAMKVTVKQATKTVTQQNLLGSVRSAPERKRVTVTGAKNILLVGVDTRKNQDPSALTRSDSIIILHIPASHDAGYMISLPRDTYVRIPAYDNGAQNFPGGKAKINAAFAYGSRGLTGAKALSGGFELLAMTIKKLTGITPDAGAIIDFEGFAEVVNVLGRVCMYVDETTKSVHKGRDDKTGKPAVPYRLNTDGTIRHKIWGTTPYTYTKGNHCFNPTEALDFVRQRDLLENNDYDYGRQRHQQQFLRAVLKGAVDQGLGVQAARPAQGRGPDGDRGRRRHPAGGLDLRDAPDQAGRAGHPEDQRRHLPQRSDRGGGKCGDLDRNESSDAEGRTRG